MELHYALRFESGERRGEVVPLPVFAGSGGGGKTFTIGRKPGNSLQVTDPSVSGRHAEIIVGESGVEIRDLGSTNGTLVGGDRIREANLDHLDEFILGAVEFTLLDARRGGDGVADAGDIVLEEPVPVPVSRAAVEADDLAQTRVQPREDSLEITAEDLARSRKSSRLGPLLIVALAAAGGAAWWWLGQRDSGGGRRVAASTPLTPPAGELLRAGYSFESSDAWTLDESAPATFDPTGSARRSGRLGVVAEVFGGEFAQLESEPVTIGKSARAVEVTAYARGDAEALLRLGLRFSSRDGSAVSTVWSDPSAPESEWSAVLLAGTAPAGMDEVRVVVRAEGSGRSRPTEDDSDVLPATLEVDDVALVSSAEAAPAPFVHDEWTVTPVGGRPGGSSTRALAVSSLDRVLVSSLRVVTKDGGLDAADLAVDGSGGSVRAQVPAAGELVLRAESAAVEAGVATLGAEGYAAHGTSFDRAAATSVLVGSDATLVRIAFDAPVDVTARPAGDDLVVRGTVSSGTTITIQVEFGEERTRAARLAGEARNQRRAGDPGAALRTWARLLRDVPFDQRLVDEAATAQSELLSEGRESLRALESEIERARFFGLAGLFREKLARAGKLSERFAGSEIDQKSNELAAVIRTELAQLDEGRDRDERVRLDGIRTVLQDLGAEDLVRRLEEYESADGAPMNDEGGSR
ncbi:MAG: FHA domain-containing protein [Planctomycetota bacterium]